MQRALVAEGISTDFNDIFRDLERNTQRIYQHYQLGSNKFLEYAFKIMDEMWAARHDQRKSAVLKSKLQLLVSQEDTGAVNHLKKKDIATMHNEPPQKAERVEDHGMSFGDGSKKQPVALESLEQEEHTFNPMVKSVLKNPELKNGAKSTKSFPAMQHKPHPHKAGLMNLNQLMREADLKPYVESPKSPEGHQDIEQLIKSTRKLGIDVQRKVEQDNDQDQGVEYIMTDYSSNESSNDNVYDTEYREQAWPVTDIKSQTSSQTENLFSGNLIANSNPIAFDFEALKQLKKTESSTTTLQQPLRPNSLLKSAIKSNSKRKMRRLYCRDKRIPFWAEHLDVVGRNNRNMDPNKIFGRCVVENLNAEYLFPMTQQPIDNNRSSSAKWSPSWSPSHHH